MRDSAPPSSSFGEEALREILSKILDQSVPSGAETSLETLAYAARKLKTESNRNRARIARKLKDAYGSGRSNEEEEFGDEEEEREEVAECCERFCEEFLELLSEEETARREEGEENFVVDEANAGSCSTFVVREGEEDKGEEKEGTTTTMTKKKNARRLLLRDALMNMRKDARTFLELEEKLELKQLHLEMLREEKMFEECLDEVERMILDADVEKGGGELLSKAHETLERAREEYACVEMPNERIDDLMVKLQDAIRRKIAASVSVSDDGDGVVVVEFANARDAWKASRVVSETLFRECAVFVTRKVVDDIVVPFVESRARSVALSVDEENGYAKTLKWKNGEEKDGENKDEGGGGGIISALVHGLDVVLFKGIFTKHSFALDELSSDLVDVARGVLWPTVSKTCIEMWNLGSKQALLTDDDVDSVVALEKRVAGLGLLNSYGLGDALDTVAGPLEIAAMQGEIESRLDFRVNSLASARDAGKVPAISDELLRTKAKEEEYAEDATTTTTKYCEEFFELHCFEHPASRTITNSAVQLLNVTKSAFHSILSSSSSSSSEDKENTTKDANTPAGRKRHAIAAIKTACDCLEAFRCARMSARDESIFKQSLFESLVFYNDCGFIADQFIAQSLDAAKALEKIVRKDSIGDNDDEKTQQHRPAILWAVEALRDAGDAVFERAERNASHALEDSLDAFTDETQSVRGARASAMKKAIQISRDVLKKFCSAASQTLQRTNAKRIVGKFCELYASRIVSAIKEMQDISADDADALTDALEDAFTPLQLGASSVDDDFLYDALEQWQKGAIYVKLLKTKLKEITDMCARGELKILSEKEVLAFISACFADTPLREECFERIENMKYT